MTFGVETSYRGQHSPVLWITGLSGSGKTTLARLVTTALRNEGKLSLLLDGDLVRDALEPVRHGIDHGPCARLERAWRIARLARMAALQNIPVIVSTISLFHEVQAWNRDGPVPYAEVFLQVPMGELQARKPELYGSATRPPQPQVVGLDVAAQYPQRPELVLTHQRGLADLPRQLEQTLSLWRALIDNKS